MTFHNPENGFCVLRLKVPGRRDLETVVGHAASVSAGEEIRAVGEWLNDLSHGLQFRATSIHTAPPSSRARREPRRPTAWRRCGKWHGRECPVVRSASAGR